MAGPKGDFDSPLSRYGARKRDLDSSMLEYSHRMRDINATRGGLYRYEGRLQHDSPTLGSSKSPVAAFEAVTPRHHNTAFEYRGHNSPQTRYPRHQRPLSFDEKELQLNQAARDQRPRRDTKSERPPVIVPDAGLPPVTDGDSLRSQEDAKRFRVSLVQASDLYDLVDLSLKDKGSRENRARLANVEEGVRLMEEMERAIRRKREHQEYSTRKRFGNDKPLKPILSVSDTSDLLISKSIKNDVATKRDKNRQDKTKHEEVYVLDDDSDTTGQNTATRQESAPPTADSNRLPIDVFLQQAVSTHKKNIMQLKVRPKRAKRMQLHKPELLAIPEDGGTFIRPLNAPTDQKRHEMLVSNSNVPFPTSTSLTAIREVAPFGKTREAFQEQYPNMGSPQKQSPRHQTIGGDEPAGGKKSPRKPKGIRDRETRNTDGLDIDDLLLTSIYPPMPWEAGVGRDLRLRHMTVDKPTHKERAQRKMKRLIFLRDQPDQNYKREI
ncbi:uncharacterized protein LOC101847566 [Aplysia californica]|uniref:Uncharacterized protein LOC101847566 n=1 Tax=Aplysia californica TaxID=6500 RepID=A0ABM0JI87_APLCA|nr:uncharacterized protein LOC101847566 [Aplysia californica]